MYLKRKGYNRNSGFSFAFENRPAQLSFDPGLGCVNFKIPSASGMGSQGEYEYHISLDPNDLAALLDFLAQQRSILEESTINTQLRTQSHSILRLLIASSGLPLALQPSELAVRLAELRKKELDKVAHSS